VPDFRRLSKTTSKLLSEFAEAIELTAFRLFRMAVFLYCLYRLFIHEVAK
jgi:hypothetical protein